MRENTSMSSRILVSRSRRFLLAKASATQVSIWALRTCFPSSELVEGRAGGRDLEQDVDAVAIVLDHALDPLDLPADALDPVVGLLLHVRLHRVQYIPVRGICKEEAPREEVRRRSGLAHGGRA